MKYFDTSYLVRLYYQDAGWQNVRAIAATDYIASSLIGRAETVAAFHRKFREGSLDKNSLAATVDQFNEDCSSGAFHWLPISERVIDRLTMVFKTLQSPALLRGADAIHLASAGENGFTEIYSNDRHLLAAAPFFALTAKNVI